LKRNIIRKEKMGEVILQEVQQTKKGEKVMRKITFDGKAAAIKIGSSSLVDASGRIIQRIIVSLARQVNVLLKQGYGVVIVTSGAVASGRKKDWSKQLCAAVGQAKLMRTYERAFGRFGIPVAQILVTDRELETGNVHGFKTVLGEAFLSGVVCIVNANDPIDSEELNALETCSDNDKLFGLACVYARAYRGIIVFNEDGFRGDDGKIVSEINTNELEAYLPLAIGSSALGHGDNGMATKLKVLCGLAENKIASNLVSVREKNFILRAMLDEQGFGTRFV
jgi:glutamate 5-kinase